MTAREAQRRLRDAFARACASAADQFRQHDYVIGGARTRVRIVGRDLARGLQDVFFHLKSAPAGAPDLCVDVWDARASGVPAPRALPCEGATTCTFDHGTLATADGDRHVVFERGDAVTWLDRSTSHVVACRDSAETLPLVERAKPFTPLISVWLRDRDLHTVHAALVATGAGGALVAGGSGVGKTTCALRCLEAGFAYLADDVVAVQRAPSGGFTGHSLYGSSRILAHELDRAAWLRPHAIPGRPPAEPKAVVLLRYLAPARLLGSVPLRVILLPRIVPTPTTRVRPAGKAETLRTLVASSLLTRVPAPSRQGAAVLAALVDRVPAYHLELGGDVHALPAQVRETLVGVTG